VIRDDIAVDAVQLADGSFLALVRSNPNQNPCCDSDVLILKVDANGTLITSKQLLHTAIDFPLILKSHQLVLYL
jgi:hypothetical protein